MRIKEHKKKKDKEVNGCCSLRPALLQGADSFRPSADHRKNNIASAICP
jgi:hypothetical protein